MNNINTMVLFEMKNCLVSCIKYCTDKVLHVANCGVGIPSIGLIVAKSYHERHLKDVSWGVLIAPLAALIVLNLAYCFCCRLLYKTGEASSTQDTNV